MMKLLQIRLMIWKKQATSLLFWLTLPLIMLSILFVIDTNGEQNIRIPVGIVSDEQTPLIKEVIDGIDALPLVDLIHLSHDEAMHQLEMHQLDSVFAFSAGYDEAIIQNDRRGIVSHYTSNISVAAIPMKESVLSLIQEQLNRSEAAHTVERLFTSYSYPPPTRDSVLQTSKEIQENEQLIETSFTYTGETTSQDGVEPFISEWDIWIFFVLFSTIMVLDWVVRERQHPTFDRILFSSYRPKHYLLSHLAFYLMVFICMDGIALGIFSTVFNKDITISIVIASLSFRLLCTMGLFLFALCFRQTFSYVAGAIMLCIILIGTSGMIIPVDGIIRHFALYATIHPLQPVMDEQGSFLWLGVCLLLCILWSLRKENKHVTRT